MIPKSEEPKLEQECFFIAPIGDEGSDVRDRSDGVLEYIVTPAAAQLDLATIRADKIAKPGQITRQVIEHVVGAKAAVVDLTGANTNVYYEMAVRHTAQLPTVLIAQDGEKLPFDISQMRTIFFDHTSLKSAAECRDQIADHLREAIDGEVDSPISASVSVRRLEQGSAQDRVLAQVVNGVEEIQRQISVLPLQGPARATQLAAIDLQVRFDELVDWCAQSGPDDSELEVIIRNLRRPVNGSAARSCFLGSRPSAGSRSTPPTGQRFGGEHRTR